MAIEKFVAQSSKSAKYAKTTVRKRDASASADPTRKVEGAMATASANMGAAVSSGGSASGAKAPSNNNSSSNVGAAASSNYATNGGGGASSAAAASSGQAADTASNKP